MALSVTQKAAIRARLEQGGSVRGLAKEFGTTEKTVRRIKQATPIPQDTPGAVSPPAPPVSFAEEPSPPSPRVGMSAQALGEMAGLPFLVFSLFNGQGWQLEQGEKIELGGALSDCFPLLPAATAEKIVAASAPVNALAVLAKIVMRRLAKIAQVAAVEVTKRQQDMVSQHVPSTVPPPPPPRVPAPPATASAEVSGEQGQPSEVPPTTTIAVVKQAPTNSSVFARA